VINNLKGTDGEPTTPTGSSDVRGFIDWVQRMRPNNVYMTIAACTDDESAIAYLNKMDKKIKNLDVVDDFRRFVDTLILVSLKFIE
jgi:hypothetical protein